MTITPESFYIKLIGEEGKKYWNSVSDEEKYNMEIFDVIKKEAKLAEAFAEMLNFFFMETVSYKDGFFIILRDGVTTADEIKGKSDIHGIITEDTFPDVLSIIKQICCIDIGEQQDGIKFKNSIAKKIYEKMQKAAKNNSSKDKNQDFILANVISSVANKHPSINPVNVWNMTVFQLMDSFNRLQNNSIYDMQAMRVSVWGDEKRTFDAELWHKNMFTKK